MIFQAQILTKYIDNSPLVCVTPDIVLYIVHFIIVHLLCMPLFFSLGGGINLSTLLVFIERNNITNYRLLLYYFTMERYE